MTTHVTHHPTATEELPVLRTVSDLLELVERLPHAERDVARDRIEVALQGDARSCRAALGVLALDLAAPVQVGAPVHAGASIDAAAPAAEQRTRTTAPRRDLEVRIHVLDLDRHPAAASA